MKGNEVKATWETKEDEVESVKGFDMSSVFQMLIPVGVVVVLLIACITCVSAFNKKKENERNAKATSAKTSGSSKDFKKFVDEECPNGEKKQNTEGAATQNELIPTGHPESSETLNKESVVKDESVEPISLRQTKTTAEDEYLSTKVFKMDLNKSEPNIKPFIDRQPIYNKRDQKKGNSKKDKKKKRKLSDSNINVQQKPSYADNQTLVNLAASKANLK